MTLTYTTKRKLHRIGLVALIILLVSILTWFCWVVWLERYMVYSRDGAMLDFELQDSGTGQVAAPPSADETVSIYYNEGANAIDTSTDLTQIVGYYIDADVLKTDIAAARDAIAKLPAGTAVMVEVKNAKGSFHYTSSLPNAVLSGSIDCALVDALITDITSRNLYAIAVLPAFRDYNFGLNNVSCGLAVSKGYLWADDDYCYWLNPTKAGTLSYLKDIVEELRGLGFDEVVFSEFRFPDTSQIVFDGDQTEALASAAANLVSSCATNSFAISFVSNGNGFTLPEGRCRLYLQNVGASNVASIAQQSGVADPVVNLVFLATTNDTRFNDYSVLRPIGIITSN